jgi:putative DNA primase/helicase
MVELSPMDKITARLEVKNKMACCPAHNDKNPSLSVTEGDDGRVLLKCHAGCRTEDIVDALGLSMADLFPSDGKRQRDEIKREVERRTHNYSGYRKTIVKYSDGSKTAFFESFENGSWIKGLNGQKQILYNLDAMKKPGPKFLSESEKDADCLNDLGLQALSFGGAENWKPQYVDLLKGHGIIMLPHNDDPGRKAAKQAAHDLIAAGCKVKVIPSKTWGSHKGADVADWLKTVKDNEEAKQRLILIIRETPLYQVPEDETEIPRLTMRETVLTADDFIKMEIPEREHYLHPWLRDLSIILISASRGVGKSMFTIGTLLAVASGTAFGPWQSCKSVPCLYLDGEMAATDDKERLVMFQAPKGLPFYICNDAHASTLGRPKSNMNNQKWRDEFKVMLLDMGIKVVAFDNLASLTPGLDENSKQEWDPINQFLLELRYAGISSILVHHMGKAGTQRGTSGREDNIDVSIELVKPKGYVPEDGCRFIAHFTKHRLPQADLSLIAETEFKLIKKDDHYTWSWGNVAKEAKKECLRLLAERTEQKTIASILGIAEGTVSKWRKSFINSELLTDTNSLTSKGKLHLGWWNDGLDLEWENTF